LSLNAALEPVMHSLGPGPVDVASEATIRPVGTRRLTAALVGNPNTGKTTLFNALSGLRQRVGNYPGVTVETKKGQALCGGQTIDLIDLPGTYSLAPRSPDEMVAVDVILGHQKEEPRPDVVVAIVDASNLERNLYLTTQLLELDVPIVVALNMTDIAAKQGIRINHDQLSQHLGVPVVPIQANKGKGLDNLREAILAAGRGTREARREIGDLARVETAFLPASATVPAARGPRPAARFCYPEAFEREVASLFKVLGGSVELFLVRRLLLDAGGSIEKRLVDQHGTELAPLVQETRTRLAAVGCAVPAVEARTRYGWIRQVTPSCVTRPAVRIVTWTDRLDRILTHRLWGTLLFLALMFVMFQSIFTWAKPAMKLIGLGKDWVSDALTELLPAGPFTSLLTGGILEGVGSVLVFLPQIVILFGFIAVLEDCGYMARAAFLMDKLMARCGLSGKSFIPMLSSMACAVPGIMATRVIENRRDRLATILVAPLMSCSARLPVYVLLTAAFIPDTRLLGIDLSLGAWGSWVGLTLQGLTMFGLYMLGIIIAPLVAWALKRTLLRGETPLFVMEMPLYKCPALRAVLRRMLDSAWAFLRRAGSIILATMILVWAALSFPCFDDKGESYFQRVASLDRQIKSCEEQRDQLDPDDEVTREERERLESDLESTRTEYNRVRQEWSRSSYLGRLGQAIEPAVKPLGWDWRLGVATLASFPAREVVVGTLGIIFQVGKVESEDVLREDNISQTELGQALRTATWEGTSQPVFTIPVALSVMVFFALCCQCASTLAVIKRETRSWGWPTFTFAYMTVLAYLGAMVVYQVGSRLL
jgi:ferrous iron transport protein B